MFQVKICGITRSQDARIAAEAGADAIGLNFFPGSRRSISELRAVEIMTGFPQNLLRVGLFVNAEVGEVCRLFDMLRLGLIQLHGDEPPEYLAQLGTRPVMRAFRLQADGWSPILDYLGRCRELRCLPRMVLIDAFQPGHYGGTGKTADWRLLANWRQYLADMPLVLAGGLTPENVAEAIDAVHPAAVDTASGVESEPGIKNPQKVQAFVQNAQRAFARSTPPDCQLPGSLPY
jgi:phosphoribosylanthranilate isomerase